MPKKTVKKRVQNRKNPLTLRDKLRLLSPNGHHFGGDFGNDFLSGIFGGEADVGGTEKVPKGVKESAATCSPIMENGGQSTTTGGKKIKTVSTPPAVKDSCLPVHALEKIRITWNRKYGTNNPIQSNENKAQLWLDIRNAMRKYCKNEYCWVKKLGLREFRIFFRPEMPDSWNKNRYEWLSSLDIENVMN
jgi:hypothetical protein